MLDLILEKWGQLTNRLPAGFAVDTIIAVEPTGQTELVYDLTTEDHEFVANGLLIHNCHQAVSTIDHVHDNSEGGHGPHWKAWMKKVGLDPRRYDPTDETVYKTAAENATTEEKDEKLYGPRSPKHLLDEVTKGPHPTPAQMASGCDCWYVIKGRALEGKIRGKVFTYTTHKGLVSTLAWKTKPQPLTFFIYHKA